MDGEISSLFEGLYNSSPIFTWGTSFFCSWCEYPSTLVPGLLSTVLPLLLHPPQGTPQIKLHMYLPYIGDINNVSRPVWHKCNIQYLYFVKFRLCNILYILYIPMEINQQGGLPYRKEIYQLALKNTYLEVIERVGKCYHGWITFMSCFVHLTPFCEDDILPIFQCLFIFVGGACWVSSRTSLLAWPRDSCTDSWSRDTFLWLSG